MSDPRSPWPLPERPSLDQLRKQAKELRDTEHHPTLAAAQLALARRYGCPSWPKLKLAVEMKQLRHAIDDRDVARVRELLDAAAALAKGTFDDGNTPLHLAAETNQSDVVGVLVRAGAPLDGRFGSSAHSPLSWALTSEALDAARTLVELGIEPDLFCAAGLGDLDRVKAFWHEGRVRHAPSKTGSSRNTEAGDELPRPPKTDAEQVSDALYIASRLGQVDVARWLLDHGADPNWRGYSGATCLAWAEFAGSAALCALLRERGASDDIVDFTFHATPRVFPVMVFADWGFAKRLARRLMADPSLVNAQSGFGTPLHAAAAGGNAYCVRVIVAFKPDLSVRDSSGRTPADVAAAKGHAEIVALLKGL